MIINDIHGMLITGGRDRLSNHCLKSNVRTEQVAGHLARVWWTISPIWCMEMNGNFVLYQMIPSNPFHNYPLLIYSHLSWVKYAFWINKKSHKMKMQAKVENLGRSNLDIVLYYDNHQQYSRYLHKWEEVDFDFSHFHKFDRPVTLTSTSDDFESHIVAHVLSTSTNISYWLVATLCLIVDTRMDRWTQGHVFTKC